MSPISALPIRQGDLLWEPPADALASSGMGRYAAWLAETRGLRFADYGSLWKWSVAEPEAFWESVAVYFHVLFHRPPDAVLTGREVAGADWFPGATLNYAEHALRDRSEEIAILFEGEPDSAGRRRREEISRAELARRVAAAARGLRRLGVGRGDRVAGYLSNLPETVIAFLATASLGAIWSNCSAELSAQGAIDRLAQIGAKVLIALDGYGYGGKTHDRRAAVAEIAAGLPGLGHLVWVENLGGVPALTASASLSWSELTAGGEALPEFEPVPFAHPLWILYSSGTTGLPKPIVHGHGGILLEHLKALGLHLDLRPGDRFFWYTASGWMMWNFLVSGLLLPGVTVALYDGSPKYPDWDVLWEFVERNQIAYFGTSAPFLIACMKEGLAPGERFRLGKLRALGSTGAPLPPEGFAWVRDRVKASLPIGSVSGGTDVCTAFLLSHPGLPVRAGEIQCAGLGAAIEAWDDAGEPLPPGQIGELVLTAPFPSMPVAFWNDADGSRLRASYFERFPGAWHHGDWIEFGAVAERIVIHGRSDATLNRGGVRMGSAEFYRILEKMPEIGDALVIDLPAPNPDRQDRLLLFIVLREGHVLDAALRDRIAARLRTEGSPRHIPDEIAAVPDLPRTLNGKKLEVPLKRILGGADPDRSVSRASLANPRALDFFINLAGRSPVAVSTP